jgi:hypothetical protein
MAVFDAALSGLPPTGAWVYGPEVFQHYCRANGVSVDTAAKISVDLPSRLARELKAAQVMVLRLGPREGGRTAFALVRHEDMCLAPFFLQDETVFVSDTETFIPNESVRTLFPFGLLPSLSETSLLTLAHASGLMAEALGCDPTSIQMIPATGAGTYSFRFSVGNVERYVLEHLNGQIEVDAVCVAQRYTRNVVIVTEAKKGVFDGISKHKLAYSVWAVRSTVPRDIPIVPVYMRVVERPGELEFNIAECAIEDGAAGVPSLHSLHVVRSRRLTLRKGLGFSV